MLCVIATDPVQITRRGWGFGGWNERNEVGCLHLSTPPLLALILLIQYLAI